MISVCIATYNGEKYIYEQLQSIREQLSEFDEIIISDHGSTDNTIQVIKEINDSRIKILYNNKKSSSKIYSSSHINASINFENAIKNSKGDYIFLSDQDDIWMHSKVEKMTKKLNEEKTTLVMSNFSIINTNNELIKERFFINNPISNYEITNLIKMPFHGCCIAFRKELLKKVLPFPKNLLLHDNWIGFLAKGHIKYIDEPLILYRRHHNNVSSEKGRSRNPLWYKIYYRIVFYFKYISRLYF